MNNFKKLLILILLMLATMTIIACEKTDTTNNNNKKEEKPYSKLFGYEYNPNDINDYELVWGDEFDYEGLPDPKKWDYDVGGDGFGNNELQYYTRDENAWVEDGKLIIEARNELYEKGGKTWNYTSANVVSRGKKDFKYGKIQVKAKIPAGVGTWPAIWMMPSGSMYGQWPKSGEIDIMEHVGYDNGKIHGSIHTEAFYHKINTQKSGQKYVKDATEEFHVYEIEWLPERIYFKIDGEIYYRYLPLSLVSVPNYKHWPFDIPFYLLMNIAIGGDWGGVRGVDDDIFPVRMEIDYVRVYQSETITNLRRID